jgi:competence protein ComEA
MLSEMDRKLQIILVLIVTNLLSLGAFGYQYFFQTEEPTALIQEDSFIYVHLLGEVVEPNIYRVATGTRLFELIELAGGLTAEANLGTNNLSQVLKDEMKIKIASLNPNETGGLYPDESGLVNLNSATLTELMSLSGIGAVKAQNIINYREKFGPFYFIEDLLYVSGIGEITFENIKDAICV